MAKADGGKGRVTAMRWGMQWGPRKYRASVSSLQWRSTVRVKETVEVRSFHASSKGKRTVQPLSRISTQECGPANLLSFRWWKALKKLKKKKLKKKIKKKKSIERRQRLFESHSYPWLPWRLRPGYPLQALFSGLCTARNYRVQPLRGFPVPFPVQGNHFLKLDRNSTLFFVLLSLGIISYNHALIF